MNAKVNNLDYTLNVTAVTLTWNKPDDINTSDIKVGYVLWRSLYCLWLSACFFLYYLVTPNYHISYDIILLRNIFRNHLNFLYLFSLRKPHCVVEILLAATRLLMTIVLLVVTFNSDCKWVKNFIKHQIPWCFDPLDIKRSCMVGGHLSLSHGARLPKRPRYIGGESGIISIVYILNLSGYVFICRKLLSELPMTSSYLAS